MSQNQLLLVFLPLLATLVGVMAYFGHVKAKRRRKELQQVARKMAWQYQLREEEDWELRYPELGCFRMGDDHHRAYNLMRLSVAMGNQKLKGTMGDYRYDTHVESEGRTVVKTHRFSFLLVELPFDGLPHFDLYDETFVSRIKEFLGFNDIDFESEEFSRQYCVHSESKQFAYNLLDPRMIEFLLAAPPPELALAVRRLCLRSPECWQPDEFPEKLAWCERFLAHWPRHLKADLTSRVTV